MKVSFDVDGTLTTEKGQAYLKKKQSNPIYVTYIVTGQCENQKTLDLARELGIPQYRVYFTCGKPKWKVLKALGIEIHLDNNSNVAKEIRENTNVKIELV